MSKIRIQAYIDSDLRNKLLATAKENNRSESNMLIEVLESYYKNKVNIGEVYEKIKKIQTTPNMLYLSPREFANLWDKATKEVG